MKRNNERLLVLEVLEDRLALNGGFSGAIMSTPLSFQPISGLTVPPRNIVPQGTGFRGSFVDFNIPPYGQLQSLQSQIQSYQASQVAMIDQFFTEMASMFKQFYL
ncbi:MAG: hypothetical protein ACYC3I_20775 [Gemmataceae bacterium]